MQRGKLRHSLGGWFVLLWLAVVVGACCCLGLSSFFYNAFFGGTISPIFIISMFAPMGLIMALLLWRILKSAMRIVEELAQAMDRVASGEFSVRLGTKRASGTVGEMYRDFNRMTEQLDGMETLRKGFVADFSHEFKTPINSINGLANLLLDREVPADDRDLYLRTIASESDRLANLAANTLLMNRLDSQSILPAGELFALDEQIRQCLVVLQPAWSAKRIELDLDLEAVSFGGNEEMLQEVWINLIDNAIKFTPEGGTVGVKLVADREHGLVQVTVSDTGIGMTPEVCTRVFERYFQGDLSHATKGHGLGLAIVQRIVSLSGGGVAVESRLGQGSSFTVTLPLTKEHG